MTKRRTCSKCGKAATHEWHITAGVMGGWDARCDEHKVRPSVPGEMLSGCERVVRRLDERPTP